VFYVVFVFFQYYHIYNFYNILVAAKLRNFCLTAVETGKVFVKSVYVSTYRLLCMLHHTLLTSLQLKCVYVLQ